MKITHESGEIRPIWDVGTNPGILDKGCIIFDVNKDDGYSVIVIDTKSRNDAKYWMDDFLHLTIRDSNYRKTQTVTTACKQYITEHTVEDKSQKSLALNKLVEYISENESLDVAELSSTMSETVPTLHGMEEFIVKYATERDVAVNKAFTIDNEAARKTKQNIRAAIKLDTGIEIKISSSSSEQHQYVERGYDKDRQMNYYKVYFHNEKE